MPESTLARTQNHMGSYLCGSYLCGPRRKVHYSGKANRRERKQTKGPKLAIEESVVIRAIESSKEEHKVRKQSAKSKEHRC